ncbi:MAG: SPOR domain-containing protein [Burkholderiales bacterium]
MKWLFYFLLLVNVGCFAYMQLGNGGETTHAPFNAGKIKLFDPKETPAAALKPAAKMETAIATVAARPSICVEWGGFAAEDQARARATLDQLQLGDKLGSRNLEEGATYWVLIPPVKTKADAEKKIAELKARGVSEYFLMPDGPTKYAISLGIFKSEELATSHLANLQAKGVRSATITERTPPVTRTLYQIRDAAEPVIARLTELQHEFPGSEVKTVDCSRLETAAAPR